jgi:carboxypeptidase family protein
MRHIALCLLFFFVGQGQQNPLDIRGQIPGTGAVEGVVRDLNGKTIEKSIVYAYDDKSGRIASEGLTDSGGNYVLKGLRPGSYQVYAYKEEDGYPNTFFAFWVVQPNWKIVQIAAGQTTKNVAFELGPKSPILKLFVQDEKGEPTVATVVLIREGGQGIAKRANGLNGNEGILMPPSAPFHLRVEKAGYADWKSPVYKMEPGDTMKLTVKLGKRASTGTVN